MKPIYLDYNATTPIDPRVAEAMLPYLHEHFGNPSSNHLYGSTTKKAVEKARKQVAELLRCRMEEIVFTSGGSESNNFAIKGVAEAYRHKGNHIITSAIEHPAVIEVCHYLEDKGFRVTYLPVDGYGLVDPEELEANITPQTILVSIMHANNEVGTVQPIAAIAEIAHRHGVLVHSDCAQSVGKIPVTVPELGVDLLSVAGHKLYAPKGVGVLYIRSGLQLPRLIHGASHEMNRRAGTENVLGIVGLGEACQLINQHLPEYRRHMQKMRDRLEKGLRERFKDIRVNGHPEKRLPNTSSISFRNLEANTILAELEQVAASAGAACHSDQIDVSTVLQAMKVPLEYAMGTIRFSVGRFTTAQEIDRALDEITRTVEKLQPRETATVYLDTETRQVKLTHFTHGMGCACKLRPQLLEEVLRKLPGSRDEKVLVGTDTADDAAVYRLSDDLAIVQTVDFFTPIVDDPYAFGAIAAANSFSDIYAMGGTPQFALNVVGFPSERLPLKVLEEILRGAQDKAAEAGVSIIGGHTVDDNEPKFGLAVTGIIHPERILTNRTARAGDALILTKPLGTGILSTALKRGLLGKKEEENLVRTMAALNKTAAEIARDFPISACTDVTGFGLLGHLLEMMKASATRAEIYFSQIPFLPKAEELATGGVVPGGTRDNEAFVEAMVAYDSAVTPIQRLLLNDAQTSGGLLFSLPAAEAEKLLQRLREARIGEAMIIGTVSPWQAPDKYIRVQP